MHEINYMLNTLTQVSITTLEREGAMCKLPFHTDDLNSISFLLLLPLQPQISTNSFPHCLVITCFPFPQDQHRYLGHHKGINH